MKKLGLLMSLLAVLALTGGCSKDDAGGTEPPVKGNAPEVKQATPDQKSPEERARMQGGGGEGS